MVIFIDGIWRSLDSLSPNFYIWLNLGMLVRDTEEMVEMVAFHSRSYHIWPWDLANIQETRQGKVPPELPLFTICFCIPL